MTIEQLARILVRKDTPVGFAIYSNGTVCAVVGDKRYVSTQKSMIETFINLIEKRK